MSLVWGTCQTESPKSAVVVGLLHNSLKSLLHWRWLNLWLTVLTGISDLDFVLAFHFSPLWMGGAALRTNSIDAILEDKELMKMHVDLQKRFPIYHVCPKCLAALLCGTAIRKNASTAYGLQALGQKQMKNPSAPRGDHLSIPHPGHGHPAAEQQSPLRRDSSRFPQVPFQHSRSRVAPLVQAGRTIYLALRRPDCTLIRLFALVAEEYDRPVTQSIATPEPGCPDPHPKSSRSLLKPWVCHHTREPTVLSRVTCRPTPEFWPFSPALPVTLAHPSLPPKHGWLGQGWVRTVVPVPRGGHLPFLGSPALPPLRLTGRFCHTD